MLHPNLALNTKLYAKQKYRQQQRHDVIQASHAVDVQVFCNCAAYVQIWYFHLILLIICLHMGQNIYLHFILISNEANIL